MVSYKKQSRCGHVDETSSGGVFVLLSLSSMMYCSQDGVTAGFLAG